MILFLIVVSAGCAPRPLPVATPRPVPEMPEYPAFQNAERAFENGMFAEALDGYHAFLLDAYDSHFADAALFKIGKIFRLTGREDDALAVFFRLRHEFPESSLASDAMLEILTVLYEEERFQAVVVLYL